MSLITRKERIVNKFIQDVETSAEWSFKEDEGLFKIDMTKYPRLRNYYVLEDEELMGLDKANRVFGMVAEFGYTFWDRNDSVVLDWSVEDILDELGDESDSMWHEIQSEYEALTEFFEDEIQKNISYWQHIQWDIQDCKGYFSNLTTQNAKNYWENNIEDIVNDVNEEIEVDMFEAQINNMRALLDKNPAVRGYSVVQDGLRELWCDFNMKPNMGIKDDKKGGTHE